MTSSPPAALRSPPIRRARVSPSAVARSMTLGADAREAAPWSARCTVICLHEVGGRQPAAHARGAGGRQHVVRADGVVAGHLRRPRADEQRAGACAPAPPCASSSTTRCSAARLVGQVDRLLQRRGDDDAAVRAERRARRAVRGHARRHRARDALGQRPARRDQHRARVGIVLGLRDEVGGNPVGRPLGRDDDDLGGPGVEVDAAVGRDQRLGRRDVAVARARRSCPRAAPWPCRRRAPPPRARRRGGTAATRRLRAPPPSPPAPGRGQTATTSFDAGGDGGNRRHQQRRGQGIAAARARSSRRGRAG